MDNVVSGSLFCAIILTENSMFRSHLQCHLPLLRAKKFIGPGLSPFKRVVTILGVVLVLALVL